MPSVTSQAKQKYYGKIIVIKRSGQDSASFELSDQNYLFGRAERCDIRIQLSSIAEEHCRIFSSDNGTHGMLQNLSSVGTSINGVLIKDHREHVLKGGDVVTIVERSFRYENPFWQDAKKEDEQGTPMRSAGVSTVPTPSFSPIKAISSPSKLQRDIEVTLTPSKQPKLTPTKATPNKQSTPQKEQSPAKEGAPKLQTPTKEQTPERTLAKSREQTPFKVSTPSLGSPIRNTPLKFETVTSPDLNSIPIAPEQFEVSQSVQFQSPRSPSKFQITSGTPISNLALRTPTKTPLLQQQTTPVSQTKDLGQIMPVRASSSVKSIAKTPSHNMVTTPTERSAKSVGSAGYSALVSNQQFPNSPCVNHESLQVDHEISASPKLSPRIKLIAEAASSPGLMNYGPTSPLRGGQEFIKEKSLISNKVEMLSLVPKEGIEDEAGLMIGEPAEEGGDMIEENEFGDILAEHIPTDPLLTSTEQTREQPSEAMITRIEEEQSEQTIEQQIPIENLLVAGENEPVWEQAGNAEAVWSRHDGQFITTEPMITASVEMTEQSKEIVEEDQSMMTTVEMESKRFIEEGVEEQIEEYVTEDEKEEGQYVTMEQVEQSGDIEVLDEQCAEHSTKEMAGQSTQEFETQETVEQQEAEQEHNVTGQPEVEPNVPQIEQQTVGQSQQESADAPETPRRSSRIRNISNNSTPIKSTPSKISVELLETEHVGNAEQESPRVRRSTRKTPVITVRSAAKASATKPSGSAAKKTPIVMPRASAKKQVSKSAISSKTSQDLQEAEEEDYNSPSIQATRRATRKHLAAEAEDKENTPNQHATLAQVHVPEKRTAALSDSELPAKRRSTRTVGK